MRATDKIVWSSRPNKGGESRWQIREYYSQVYNRKRIAVDNNDRGQTDYPMFHDGRVYYDFPERVPHYVKVEVRKRIAQYYMENPLPQYR